MKTYGQYCPIARTAELFAERWTPIVIRNLLAGCRTFAELVDGAPGISRALLAQRLDRLERHGIITKRIADGRRRVTYELTEQGRAMKSITDAMGVWGATWLELEPQHSDPAYALWATSRLVDVDQLPGAGLIVRFDLRGHRPLWLVLRQPHGEVCSAYPGRDEDLVVTTDAETLARWHLRHITYADARRAGQIVIEGPRQAEKMFLAALRPSPYAISN